MMHDYMLLLPVICPVIGGLASAKVHTLKLRRLVVSAILLLQIALITPIMFMDTGTLQLIQLAPGVRLVLRADMLSRFFSMLIAVIWFFVAIFAYEYMNHESHRERFFCFYLITLGTLMGICYAGNLVTLYMFYEMMTICTVPLVLHIGTRRAFEAAQKYLTFSVAGAALGLLGLFFLQKYCTTDIFTSGGVLDMALAAENRQLLLIVFVVMAVGFGCKAGMFPLHAWLPIAHPVAPAPASAVLSGLITKMGVVALIRVTYYLFGWEFLAGSWAQVTVLVLALITILMGSTLALREDTLKKRLAYSSVSQVSYVIFGLMLFNPAAFTGALYQAVFHAIAKNVLFMATGAIIYKTHITQVSQMRGVGTAYPITMWCFALSSVSLVGIPPTGGFVAKWVLVQGSLENAGIGALSYVGLAILMLSALLTAAYLLPIVTRGFFPGKGFDNSHIFKQHGTPFMWLALCVLTAVSMIFGMFPNLLGSVIDPIINSLF